MSQRARAETRRAPRRGLKRSAVIGGATALMVSFSFVAANALWNQPHAHKGAIFATRAPAANETVIRIERRQIAADPVVARVQGALSRLKLYDGPVDGIAGRQTREAIALYRQIAGMGGGGLVDAALLARLEVGAKEPAKPSIDARFAALPEAEAPVPAPASLRQAVASAEPAREGGGAAIGEGDPRIVKIQAGLKALGNDGITVDGVAGSRTKAAIRELESLFGLPQTGEPNNTVYAKMREIGLTN